MATQPDVAELNVIEPSPKAHGGPLANRNFLLLWMGENVSLLGDQFYFVALPWLVFQMTGSSLAFGTLLMVGGIPRAILMILGGVVTDRFTPRAVMLTSNLLRLIITVLLTLIVAAQVMQLWMLYIIVFCFGLVDAFFHPAYRAMLPMIVEPDDLKASNSLMQSGIQLSQIAGPGIAGILVHSVGVALSFALDALTFVFTSIMLLMMRPTTTPQQEPQAQPETPQPRSSLFTEIGDMLTYVRRDKVLPTLISAIAAINFLFNGPLIVGTATLGKVRFVDEGPIAFGAMLTTFAVGMLIGTLVAGIIRTKRPGFVSIMLVATEGVFLVGVGYTQSLLVACGLMALIGIGAGFGNVHVITITQKRVTKEMIGRVMSVIVLAEIGLTPISNGLAGLLADINVTALFVAAGVLLTITALIVSLNPDVRAVEE